MKGSVSAACVSLAGFFLSLMLVLGQTGCAGRDYYEETQVPNHEHLPSSRPMARAASEYEAGRHAAAMEQYRVAARWADKFAQYNIGVMYLRGEGVEPDLARGWAWLALSAERDYPQMLQPAEELYELLDESTREEGRDILEEELLPKYGDEVAIERTARRMERERRQATGTRTGSEGMIAFLTIHDGSGITRQGTEYYAEEAWDFEQIVESERQFMFNWAEGRIELGDFELIDDEEDNGED